MKWILGLINVSLESSCNRPITAAKSLQSCPTLCDPIDSSPQGSPIPGILQARTLEWVAISFFNAWKWKVKVKLLSRVRLLVTPRTAAFQAPPSMGFSRQEYWSGLPLQFTNLLELIFFHKENEGISICFVINYSAPMPFDSEIIILKSPINSSLSALSLNTDSIIYITETQLWMFIVEVKYQNTGK